MEIINQTPPPYNRPEPWRGDPLRNVYAGAALIVAGVVWLLYNLDVLGPCFFNVVFSWQMLIVVVGGFLLSMRNWTAGGIVTGVGVGLLLCKVFGWHISFHDVVLPVILIASGLAILFTRRRKS